MPMDEPAQKILLTCITNPIGKALAQTFESDAIPFVVVSPNQIDWSDAALVDELFARVSPFLLINTLSLDARYRAEHTAFAKQIATASSRHEVQVIHFSDYHVFGGEAKNTYYETDKPAPLTDFGTSLVTAEQCFIEHLSQYFILRVSWLLSFEKDNLLTRLLSRLESNDVIQLSEDYRGSPTWTHDVARVTVGIVKQIITGADNWGVFHYCSEDKCSEWEFGALIAEQFTDIKRNDFHISRIKDASRRLRAVPLAQRDDEEGLIVQQEPASAVLSCRRIRNNFGIQPRTWRQGLKAQIRNWLQDNSADAGSNHNKVDAVS